MNKYFRKLAIVSLFVFLMLINTRNIYAAVDGIVNNTNVNVRKEATTSSSSITTLNTGAKVSLVDKTLYSGTGCSSKWYKITYNGSVAYVCSQYVTIVDNTFKGITVLDWEARTHSNSTPLRSGPGTNYSSAGSLIYGTNITILGSYAKGSGCDTNWYQIRYHNNQKAYTCGTNIHKKADITLNDAIYAKELKDKGFPDSYIPYLTYMHSKHPNWNFNADINNLYFALSVDGEDNKNYIQSTINAYRKSSTPAEGSSWFYAKTEVTAFFLDPRNFLNEKNIFMFEKLDYDSALESKYPATVKAVFGTGKLGDDKYIVPMVSSGKAHKVSPVHIATRIRQEVGANGNDATSGAAFTWEGKTYTGIYNFFNIGAYGSNPLLRGLAYAANIVDVSSREKWDTIEKAMLGGSKFLANGYINSGQNTLYYQKFNTYPGVKNPYTHQYMTNVQAPTSEGSSAYSSYKSEGLLNLEFTFDIPVYTNMPAYTSLPQIGDTNNELSSITINGNLVNNFDKDVLSYTYYVSNTLTKVTVGATTVSTKSTISGNGTFDLTTDNTVVTITVTSENGEVKSYNVTIIKTDDNTSIDEIIGKLSVKVDSTYLKDIKNGTTIATLMSSLSKASPTASFTIKESNGTVSKNTDVLKTNQKLTIVTNLETRTYTLVVKGDTSGDGKVTILDLLQVQKNIIKDSLLKDAYLLGADTSGDGKVTILDLLQVQKHIIGEEKL